MMADIEITDLRAPAPLTSDLEKAVKVLKEEGCREIYVFGSIATHHASEASDIDLGIRDYPKERFFRIYARLMTEMNHEFDLVDFELNAPMFDVLTNIGEVQRIA